MIDSLLRQYHDILLKLKSHRLTYPLADPTILPDEMPFFIVGSGRCGTTLLRKILLQDTQLVIPPESGGLLEGSIKFFLQKNHLPWPQLVEGVLNLWDTNADIEFWELGQKLNRQPLLELETSRRNLHQVIKHIYLSYARVHRPDGQRWGDKSPYATFGLDWIVRMYDKSSYIHMMRDGRDVVNSFIKHGLFDSLEAACERWNRAINILDRYEHASNFITIRYEDLVTDTAQQIIRLSDFLQVPLKPTHVSVEGSLGDDHLPHHGNLSKPITSLSIGNWKSDLSKSQQAKVQKLLGGNLEKTGYV
jgi:hypothetical protein